MAAGASIPNKTANVAGPCHPRRSCGGVPVELLRVVADLRKFRATMHPLAHRGIPDRETGLPSGRKPGYTRHGQGTHEQPHGVRVTQRILIPLF